MTEHPDPIELAKKYGRFCMYCRAPKPVPLLHAREVQLNLATYENPWNTEPVQVLVCDGCLGWHPDLDQEEDLEQLHSGWSWRSGAVRRRHGRPYSV